MENLNTVNEILKYSYLRAQLIMVFGNGGQFLAPELYYARCDGVRKRSFLFVRK